MATIRISVREEVVEYQTIEFEVADDIDLTDEDAVNAAAEAAFTDGAFKAIALSNDVEVKQRMYFDPEMQQTSI